MRHITIKQSDDGLVDEFIVTIEGNNFGDQIISFRKYAVTKVKSYGKSWTTIEGYEDCEVDSYPEGGHLSDEKIIELAKEICKKY